MTTQGDKKRKPTTKEQLLELLPQALALIDKALKGEDVDEVRLQAAEYIVDLALQDE